MELTKENAQALKELYSELSHILEPFRAAREWPAQPDEYLFWLVCFSPAPLAVAQPHAKKKLAKLSFLETVKSMGAAFQEWSFLNLNDQPERSAIGLQNFLRKELAALSDEREKWTPLFQEALLTLLEREQFFNQCFEDFTEITVDAEELALTEGLIRLNLDLVEKIYKNGVKMEPLAAYFSQVGIDVNDYEVTPLWLQFELEEFNDLDLEALGFTDAIDAEPETAFSPELGEHFKEPLKYLQDRGWVLEEYAPDFALLNIYPPNTVLTTLTLQTELLPLDQWLKWRMEIRFSFEVLKKKRALFFEALNVLNERLNGGVFIWDSEDETMIYVVFDMVAPTPRPVTKMLELLTEPAIDFVEKFVEITEELFKGNFTLNDWAVTLWSRQ